MFRAWHSTIVSIISLGFLALIPSALSQMQPNGQSCDGDCGGQLPACQNSWQPYVSAVFLGRVTEVEEQSAPILLGVEKKLTEKLSVTFTVEESFIGVSGKIVKLASGGDLCAFPFSKGRSYLVYAKRLPSGELYVSTCYGTKFAENSADDLNYLRALPNAPEGATVFGTARRFTEPLKTEFQARRTLPETGRTVTIQGMSQTYEATVDEHGTFTIGGLPPGRYTVSLNSIGEVYTSPHVSAMSVDVANRGCARFNFWIDPYSLETAKFRCPLPPDFQLVRADREGKRLFLEATESNVASHTQIDSYLKKLDRVIEHCEPSWKASWSASFFASPKLAGYKTDAGLLEAVESGDWGKAYIAEYDRGTQRFTIFPLDPQKQKTRQVAVSR